MLITGAAPGIGEATVHAFARDSAKVCCCGRRESRCAAVEKTIRVGDGEAMFVPADVRHEAQIKALVAPDEAAAGVLKRVAPENAFFDRDGDGDDMKVDGASSA